MNQIKNENTLSLTSKTLPNNDDADLQSWNINVNEDAHTRESFISVPISEGEEKSKNIISQSGKDATTGGETNKTQKGWKKYRGIILTIVAAIQFSLSALIIKVLGYHPFNLGVWRFLVMMIIPIPFIWHALFWKKQKVFKALWPVNSTLVYLVFQAIVGSNSLVLLFYALERLNVADALVISTSAPIFVTLLAFFLLNEKSGIFPFFMAILTLLGVGIICRPPILTGAATYDNNLMIGAAVSFGSMLCLATSYIIIRYLRTVHHAVVNLFFSAWGFFQCVSIAYYLDVLGLPKNCTEVFLIIATAVLAFSAQTFLTLGLKYEQAGPVSLVRTTEILFAFGWQLIFLGVVPDLFSVLGAFLVIFAVGLTAIRKMLANLPDDHKYKKMCGVLLR